MYHLILHVLILGGTNFLGPHLAEELHQRGHEITLFHRGTPSSHSLDYAAHLYGNRDGDLKALEGKHWDAIIDTSGHLPRIVESSSKMLSQATEHYTFISTIGVYENFLVARINESYPVAKLENENDEEITEKNYGALKARCEQVIQNYFPHKSLIIRPGLIVGPYDTTDRFTYWPRRIMEGGEILAPDDPKQQVQFIDARDLAKWIVDMIEKKATGIYQATGPATPLTFEQFLQACLMHSKKETQIYWIDEEFLLDQQVQDWSELPLWLASKRKMPGFQKVDITKAIQAGLTFRPLSETIADTLAWDLSRPDGKTQAGLEKEKEKKLLQIWKNLKK
jgi:2'-hydroxyisoflavone reductase